MVLARQRPEEGRWSWLARVQRRVVGAGSAEAGGGQGGRGREESYPPPTRVTTSISSPSATTADVPALLYKTFPEILADLFHPVKHESFINIAEPIQWKGGIMHRLFQGKGDSR